MHIMEAYSIVRKAIVRMRMFENVFEKVRSFEIKDAIVRMRRIIASTCCNRSKQVNGVFDSLHVSVAIIRNQ